MKKKLLCSTFTIWLIATSNNFSAQNVIPRSPTPLAGKYPGGHVGIRGGDTPEEGIGVFTFAKILDVGDLKDDQGKTIAPTDITSVASITGIAWNTKFKILGMTWGGLAAIPFNQHYNRPNDSTDIASNVGLGDVVIVPLGLYGVSKNFDYQVAVGFWSRSGAYTPGGSENHGSGFAEMLYSIGGVYYLKGNRKSFNVSAVARFEQPFKQKTTDVQPGSDVVLDWGIGSPYLPFDKAHKHLFYFGVSGFATTQLTEESGTYAAYNTNKYAVYATGPEFSYIYPAWKLKFMFRAQWEYGAKNTTQGVNYWFSLSHRFGHI